MLALKVMLMSSNRNGAAVAAKLWHTNRTAGRVSRSTFCSNAFLQFSESQNRKNVEFVDDTRLQTELFEQLAVYFIAKSESVLLSGNCICILKMEKFLHWPVGEIGISPKSNDLEGWSTEEPTELFDVALVALTSDPPREMLGRESISIMIPQPNQPACSHGSRQNLQNGVRIWLNEECKSQMMKDVETGQKAKQSAGCHRLCPS